jgi:hypothetical protein
VKFQDPLPKVNIQHDPGFSLWVANLPMGSWARYDLSACRLGWDAGREAAARLCDRSTDAAPPNERGESYLLGWAAACEFLAQRIRGVQQNVG